MSKKTGKKTIRKGIEEKLAETFSDIKVGVGDKKFLKKIRKASKIMASGVTVKKVKPAVVATENKTTKENKS